MDRGFALGIFLVFSGWGLVLLALILIKVMILPFTGFYGGGFLEIVYATLRVIVSLIVFGFSLVVWYYITRKAFRRILSSRQQPSK